MYSRTLGILDDKKSNPSIESFNRNIREQYKKKRNPLTESVLQESEPKTKTEPQTSEASALERATQLLSGVGNGLDFDTLLIIGIILILLTQTEAPDLILLGALASVIF